MAANDELLTIEETEANAKAGETKPIYKIVEDEYYFAFRGPRNGIEVARYGFIETDVIDIGPTSSSLLDDQQLYFCILTDRLVVQSRYNIRLKNTRFIDRKLSVITQQEFDSNYFQFVNFPARIIIDDETNESIVYPCHITKRDGLPSTYINDKKYFQLPPTPHLPNQ
jgi:hypothetical protein